MNNVPVILVRLNADVKKSGQAKLLTLHKS